MAQPTLFKPEAIKIIPVTKSDLSSEEITGNFNSFYERHKDQYSLPEILFSLIKAKGNFDWVKLWDDYEQTGMMNFFWFEIHGVGFGCREETYDGTGIVFGKSLLLPMWKEGQDLENGIPEYIYDDESMIRIKKLIIRHITYNSKQFEVLIDKNRKPQLR